MEFALWPSTARDAEEVERSINAPGRKLLVVHIEPIPGLVDHGGIDDIGDGRRTMQFESGLTTGIRV